MSTINTPGIQKVAFSTGGFVLHKIPFSPKSRISAWYDKDGNLTSAEFIRQNGNSYPVQKNSPAWKEAATQGRIYC